MHALYEEFQRAKKAILIGERLHNSLVNGCSVNPENALSHLMMLMSVYHPELYRKFASSAEIVINDQIDKMHL